MHPTTAHVLTALSAALVLASFALAPAAAQPRAPSLPADCRDGEVVVSQGSNRFDCVPPHRALRLGNCQTGDFVIVGSDGDLRCERPSSTTWNVRNLLPSCSSSEVLVSEGFGSWRCTSPRSLGVLPSCSSGEILISEGSSGWRCASR